MERKVKNDSADVGKRINDTKREIAQLSEELDRLIHSNNSKEQHSNELIKSLKTQENQLKTLQGDNIALRTSNIDIASTKNLNSHGSVKGMDIKPESMCKKNKTYDKEAAKEYIRQQREKREEYRKKMSSKTKIDLELKKQKLYELQQKSLALVQRNLELKRERSRSRENKQEIRIDRNNFIKSGHSLDRKTSSNITVDRKPSTETKSSFSKFFKSPDRKNVKGNKVQVKSKGYMKDPTPQLGDQNTSKISSRGRSTLKNITFRSQEFPSKSCELSYADQNLAATKIQACYKGYLVRKHQSEKKLKVKSEHCIMTDNCAKESKETQTKMRKQSPEMPVWLQPPPIDPYPCNFINTIKRKLQFVVNSPVSSRDIGVQSSIIASSSAGPNKGSKVKETIKESLKSNEKQNLNSFLSHRCFNLDADALKHLALVHSENKSGQNVNKHEKSDSESDTSKNIPEISTESGSAPLNVRSVPVEQNNSNLLLINTDKIKNLRLKNPREKSDSFAEVSNKIKVSRNYDPDKSTSKKSYTFNFYNESESANFSPKKEEIDEKSQHNILRSPRDSIISFNRTDENHSNEFSRSPRDSIISFNRSNYSVKTHTSIPKINDPQESISDSEIKTENSSISDNSKDRVSKEELSDKMVSNKDRSSSIPDSHKSEVTPIEIIENIENSINTSLVSHISDNRSDLSDHSKQEHLGSSQYSLKTKHERSGHSKASTEKNSLKKTLIRDTSTNIPKMSENSDILSERSLKPSIPTNSISSHIEADTSKSNKENIPSIDKVSSNDKTGAHSSEKTTDISVSSQITDGKDGMFKSSEFVSLYSSNFSSEKSDSNNVSLKSISKKNTLTEPIESHKTSQNDQVQSNLNLKNQSKSNSTNIEVDDVNRPMETVNTAVIQTKADMNEIHLKFEAEVHLLNDFNESLKQFMAVEKAFEIIKNKNEISSTKHHSRNSQNSKNSTRATLSEDSKVSVNLSKSLISSINVSRGSDIGDSPFLQDDLFRKPWDKLNDSSGLEISNVDQNLSKDESNFTINEKMPNNLAGLSIKMFEQLIKDEDVRIENLKTIIKIREQALLDRTKGELAWLEIQRKHLKETGRIQEASLVKKKQRGILLKHQQERREMQRLKQLQKIQSNERKTILKEQKNLIKAKLTSEKIMSELRIHTPRRRKSSGPMKVLKSSESIHSETSVSKRASDGEEIISVTSRSHSVRLSEIESSRDLIVDKNEMDMNMVADHKNLSHMKKALLMRQDALMKRRKAVEDLLQIHQKLLEEEKKIEELEMAANAVIMQIPISNQTKPSNTTKMKVKGTQLNELVQKMGVIAEKKFLDNKIYCLSQSSYNRLNREAGNYLSKHKKSLLGSSSTIETSQSKDPLINDISIQTNKTDELKEGNNQKSRNSSDIISVSKEKSPQYSEDFELDTQNIEDVIIPDEDESNLSSISELIEDFSKIEHGISMLSKQFVTRPSSAESYKSSISSENISESLNQSSVIETNKISPRTTIDNSSMVKDKSVMHTEEYNSLKGEMSTTLETIKDEDISAMIHEMIPSSTTTSLISSELEKNNESNNEISKEIKETGEISNIEVNDVSEGFIPEKLSEDLDEVISEKLIVSNISKRATSEKEGIDISSVSQEIISENNPDTLERVSLKELSEEEVMTDISEKVILEREDITKNYVLTEVIPEKDKFHSEEDNIEISENLPEEVDKTSIMEELSSEKNLDEVVAASNSEPVGIQLEELEHSLQTNTESASKDRFEDDLNSFTRDTGSVVDLQNEYSLTNHSETISTENNSKLNSFNATPIIEMTESIVPSEKHENVEEVQDNITKSENKPDQESETYSKFELENYLPDNISYVDTEAVEKSTSLDSEVSSESRALDQISLESALNKFDSNHTDKIITNNEIQLAEVLPESANDTYNSNKVSQEENYDNVEEIYQFDKKPEVSKTDSTEGNSTDISEKLSTDSEPVETPEQPHSGSSEDNYSDDFEDDKEENSHDTEKYVSKDSVPSSIANDVLMVRIDLPSESLINEAKIVVMNEERRENFDSIIEEQNDEDRKIGGLEEATDKQVIESQIETNETLEVDIPKTQGVNVMKRVSEILANTVDAPKNSKDKSVRYQDYYVTTYEDITPTNSPESVSSVKSPNVPSVNIFGNEAEELLKKQLAIEQEIKHLEQQQKEQMPFMYMREIPNKPPPPYTPPSTITSNAITILPAKVEDLNEICNYSAKVLYNAYLSNNLNSVTFSETHFKSINQTKSTKECCLFVFDLCRQVANEHYKRFEKENVPYWMKLPENSRLILGRPFDYQQLEKHINTKVKELLGFEKPEIKETSIIKWSRKKKDHVDEILILECLAQEHQWLNFDKEELIVKDKVTNEILNMLLNDTVAVFKKIFP